MEILLFVNDNVLIRSSIQNFLESVGYEVDSCLDGKDALNKFMKNEYDLILLDTNIPSLSGVDLVKAIREKNEKIPILVFCTVELDCQNLLPFVQGSFNQNTSEKELFAKIQKEINNYKKWMDAVD